VLHILRAASALTPNGDRLILLTHWLVTKFSVPSCPLKAKPRWTRRKDARPQELLAAALDLFVERGYAATRLDDVAAQAGVSKGTLYLYFANKEDLFKAVVRENVVPVLGEAEAIVSGFEGPTADLFRRIMLAWWERFGSTKAAGITKLIMAESCNFPEVATFYYEEVITRAKSLVTAMLARGVARGEFRPLDIAHAVDVVIAPMIMLMMWKHSFGACSVDPIDPHQYLECYSDLLLQGLLTDGAPPAGGN
jgi:AcrR family transcriptional regulator